MRLDDFDPNINVEDQGNRGGGFGGLGGGGGGGGGLLFGLLPLIGSRFGCGGIVVVLILLAVFGGLGNIGGMLGGGGSQTGTQISRPASGTAGDGTSATSVCTSDPAKHAACNAFSSAQKTWAAIFAQQGQQFEAPGLRFFSNNGESGCGAAQSAMGPFYCPTDHDIYLDTAFFDELANRFQAKGDFAQDYVIAHEFGHHIQNLLGTSDKVQQIQRGGSETQGNAASVRLELQADCFAGVWAAKNRDRMDPGDLEEGLTAAHAIGDDTLQQQSQGRVVPDSFTHGTSAERMKWLRRGIETGDPAQCDTFSGAI
ncbi:MULTISPECIES: neutral zinc metallopeptidase [unclassified Sphingomonas]|uniref:KPN_02809 family neutral zinc metallopeptidase n=1 Tax=unclassified Sphingomonas TaxID=196159 RepID=UPI00226A42F2|nr:MULTISPECIES: neutral zinc metallopeptidase [unclassified Sphingomonas]